MMFRITLLAALIASACYNPQFKNEIACDPSGACPAGTTCGADNRCHGPGFDASVGGMPDASLGGMPDAPSGGIPDAPGGLDVDAAVGIDAAPVGCTDNAGCATPPTPCTVAGTCNLTTHECMFPPKDCSSQNDQCNQGVCEAATGLCVKAPANAGFVCGVGTQCDQFGACGGFDPTNVCDSTGTKTRNCTSHTCQSGACTASPFVESQDCIVQTNGNPCNDQTPTISNCTFCAYTDSCAESAPPKTCTCSTPACMNDSCTGTRQTSCQQPCMRITEGQLCSPCFSQKQTSCTGGACVLQTDC